MHSLADPIVNLDQGRGNDNERLSGCSEQPRTGVVAGLVAVERSNYRPVSTFARQEGTARAGGAVSGRALRR